ncbi:MAG: phosphotransferase enzyme family protein [Micromonosporaceae bacterium]
MGLETSVIESLRLHGSGLYLLRREGVVGRTVEATDENRGRASKALRVTAWLYEQGFPTVQPVGVRLTEVEDTLVTFWRYLPQPETAAPSPVRAKALGELLPELHSLPAPPFELPTVEPLARLHAAMQLDGGRIEPVLSDADQRLLEERMAQAEQAYQALEFPLGHGLIHNDAHLGNLLADPQSRYGYALTDWEGAGWGPREIDLIQEGAPGNRFRESESLRETFAAVYGYDVASWPGWPVLRELRDLHSLAAYIRTASAKPAGLHELAVRLSSLRSGDRTRRWTAVS